MFNGLSKSALTRGAVAGAAALALSGGALVATGTSASAINRVSCTQSDFLYLYSEATTCWANAGTVSVTLYRVGALSSGNNAGYISGSGIATYFGKWVSTGVTRRTITTVHID